MQFSANWCNRLKMYSFYTNCKQHIISIPLNFIVIKPSRNIPGIETTFTWKQNTMRRWQKNIQIIHVVDCFLISVHMYTTNPSTFLFALSQVEWSWDKLWKETYKHRQRRMIYKTGCKKEYTCFVGKIKRWWRWW